LLRGLGMRGEAKLGGEQQCEKELLNAHESPGVLPRMRCAAVEETPPGTGSENEPERIRTEGKERKQGEEGVDGAEEFKAKKKRNCLTRRTKGEILCGLEVSYVPSSSPYGAVSADAAPPRTTPRSTIPTF
jgi:hypothetical protein